MTDEQINAAIAEMCGWTECRLVTKVVLSVLRAPVAYGVPPNGTYEIACLNYCADLNAMHEAEKTLKGYEQIHTYVWHLSNRKDWETDFKLMEVHISARNRAEAFLRTLGKWEESK